MFPRLLRLLFATTLLLASAEAADRPNVLLIITDDQGYGDLGVHGNTELKTPHIDALASKSVRFDRFLVNPLCAPTRAALLTGRYSLRTGAAGVSRGEETMRSEEVTIAEMLRDAGWRTGLFGKWHNGEHFPYTPTGQGFQETLGFNLGHWNNYFDTKLKRNGKWVETRGFITDVLTDAALEFIEGSTAQPFFCMLAYNAPHSPFQAPEAEFARYKAMGMNDQLASVYAMCENMDTNIGRVLARLEDKKLAENTIVIFMTDNGPNGMRFNGGMRGKKGNLYMGGVRVPFFVRWPAQLGESRSVPQLGAHIDVLPTLAELCGVPAPASAKLDGRSLAPLMKGNVENWPDRTIFIQNTPQGAKARAIGSAITQRHHFVNEGKKWELFDLDNDPGEKKDLASQQPDLVAQMVQRYQAWWRDVSTEVTPGRRPIPVGYPEEKTVELPVAQAELQGGVRFNGKHANNAWATAWEGSEEAAVEWKLNVVRAGSYAVSADLLCGAPTPGARLQISAPGVSTGADLRATPHRQVPSPDRVPRDEVYEMEWTTISAGPLKLPAGEVTLRAQLTGPANGFELKHVTLQHLH